MVKRVYESVGYGCNGVGMLDRALHKDPGHIANLCPISPTLIQRRATISDR